MKKKELFFILSVTFSFIAPGAHGDQPPVQKNWCTDYGQSLEEGLPYPGCKRFIVEKNTIETVP